RLVGKDQGQGVPAGNGGGKARRSHPHESRANGASRVSQVPFLPRIPVPNGVSDHHQLSPLRPERGQSGRSSRRRPAALGRRWKFRQLPTFAGNELAGPRPWNGSGGRFDLVRTTPPSIAS